MKNYNRHSDEGYFLEVDVQYAENLHDIHNDLPLLHNRMEIEKAEKLVANLHDNKEYIIHVKNSKQTLNHELIFRKVHRVIKFNQKAQLKSYIDMNTKLRKKSKNGFQKNIFKLMNNGVFRKTMKNVRNQRDIKLITREAMRNY